MGNTMLITLYKTNDASNVINKTLNNPLNIQIVLRRDFNLSAPELILKQEGQLLRDYNYCEMVDFGRKYFIDRIENVSNNLWKLILECDVLETYKNEILSANCRFMRKIKSGDYYSGSFESVLEPDSSIYLSDKGLVEGSSLVLSTIGN